MFGVLANVALHESTNTQNSVLMAAGPIGMQPVVAGAASASGSSGVSEEAGVERWVTSAAVTVTMLLEMDRVVCVMNVVFTRKLVVIAVDTAVVVAVDVL